MNKGYYIKARKIKDSWIAHAPPITREVWDYLLREANHTDKQYDGFTVKRGQLFRSYRQIRDDLAWRVGYRTERYHESAMKRTMKGLMNEGMIELTTRPRGNLITVLNYDRYQKLENYLMKKSHEEPQTNHKQTTTDKELIERKEKINTCIESFFQYFLLKTRKEFKLTKDKRRLIARRFEEGYTLQQLKQAVDSFVADDWPGRADHLDLIYCIGKQKGKPDNLEKWLNIQKKESQIIGGRL